MVDAVVVVVVEDVAVVVVVVVAVAVDVVVVVEMVVVEMVVVEVVVVVAVVVEVVVSMHSSSLWFATVWCWPFGQGGHVRWVSSLGR